MLDKYYIEKAYRLRFEKKGYLEPIDHDIIEWVLELLEERKPREIKIEQGSMTNEEYEKLINYLHKSWKIH